MVTSWNIFRVLGDCSHLISKCILMYAIHRNRSAEGVSLITQGLYAVVFCTRYLDIFQEVFPWNLFFKIFYISTSFYIVGLMQWVYPRTREREVSWKLGAAAAGGSLAISPFAMMLFEKHWSFSTWLWDFSEILESVCVLPQLLLLRQTTVPTVIDSYYLLALGAYRGLYLINWIIRGIDPTHRPPNAVSVIFGIVQVALYVDFAWVYYGRQRVKLRNGGVVDSDDLNRGWLLNRIFGNKHVREEDDEESAPALGGQNGLHTPRASRAKWGARGISVSADDTTLEHDRERSDGDHNVDGSVDPDAKMKDPDELALALDEDDDEGIPTAGSSSGNRGEPDSEIRNDEWKD
ncbi:ER lumen protein retaining receptor [Gaeumannomyces tritici R3-111a-1]|uniref:ER lumen protein retaining receptor n=1 Tax=Gaeumannomyces tritici (strain R3-111a-1) TaxID=644352 RepID=J3P475_GAET3|nr:ER lumen protein retaining receptor [Gaeumannomyces tritici R3-111a-1]EJT74471.1 ER lumen protein retaining receptor [Gaeumannomyces tritici R3-111a-1]